MLKEIQKIRDSVSNSIKQLIKPRQKKSKPQNKMKNSKGGQQDSTSIIRRNQVVKPTKNHGLTVIEPTRFEITPQAAKSLLRSRDYIHVPPRDTITSNGGDL